jgi:hypothetical protein
VRLISRQVPSISELFSGHEQGFHFPSAQLNICPVSCNPTCKTTVKGTSALLARTPNLLSDVSYASPAFQMIRPVVESIIFFLVKPSLKDVKAGLTIAIRKEVSLDWQFIANENLLLVASINTRAAPACPCISN